MTKGFGIVFLEAAACGIPVIGGRSGGTVDAVDEGGNGLLGSTAAELQDAVEHLLADPQKLIQMGAAGRAWAQRFTWDAPGGRSLEARCRARG